MGIISSYFDEILDRRANIQQAAELVVSAHERVLIAPHAKFKTSFKLLKSATLDIVLILEDSKSDIDLEFELTESANLQCLILSENCKISNISARVLLNGKNSSSKVKSFFYGSDSDEQKLFVQHVHNAKNSASIVLSKTVLDGSSRAEFFGDITIADKADSSDALQKNDNILLSDFAKAISHPDLNIFNNNVKCSHGATVGAIDSGTLFYMMSRGIDLSTCKNLIIDGLVSSIIHA